MPAVLLCLPAFCWAQTWSEQAAKLEQRLNQSALGSDFRLGFDSHPVAFVVDGQGNAKIKYSSGALMLGDMVSSESKAILGDAPPQEKNIQIPPEKVVELCRLLFPLGFASLQPAKGLVCDGVSVNVLLQLEGVASELSWGQGSGPEQNDRVESCLKNFGEWLAVEAGLWPATEQVYPFIVGFKSLKLIDNNLDGLTDWIRATVNFYTFQPGNYTLEAFYNYLPVSFKAGYNEQELWINAYLLKKAEKNYVNFYRPEIKEFNIVPNSATGLYFTGPFAVNKAKLRNFPDKALKGKGLYAQGKAFLEFKAKAGQTILIDAVKDGHTYESWLSVKELGDNRVFFADGRSEMKVKERENSWGTDPVLRLVRIEGDTAVFEIGYNRMDDESLSRVDKTKIEAIKQMRIQAPPEKRAELQRVLDEFEAMDKIKVEINVTYSSPL